MSAQAQDKQELARLRKQLKTLLTIYNTTPYQYRKAAVQTAFKKPQ
ncbi:MAG TPA: hypothetical protein VII95_18705 [Terriglobales bacterium]|jgi:hypothetical protein